MSDTDDAPRLPTVRPGHTARPGSDLPAEEPRLLEAAAAFKHAVRRLAEAADDPGSTARTLGPAVAELLEAALVLHDPLEPDEARRLAERVRLVIERGPA